MRFRGCAVVLIAGGVFSLLAASSRTVAATDADELIREGVALRRGGDDEAALLKFKQAYQIEQSPRALAQMGLAEQALGRWVMAYEHLHQALDAAGDPWIRKSRTPINEALNRVSDHVGQLENRGGSKDAEVRIDGVPRGKLPFARPIAVSTGTVTIDLAAPGFLPIQRTTVVRARESVRESFDALAPLPVRDRPPAPTAAEMGKPSEPPYVAAEPTTRPAEGSAVSRQDVAPTETERTSHDRGTSKSGSFRTKAKWVAWAGGAVALGVGILGGVQQNQAGNDFASGCGIDPGQNVVMLPGSTKTVADCRNLKNKVDLNYGLELGGLIGAGVLAATGLILWLTEPAPGGAQTAVLTCSPGLTTQRGPWVGCGLTF